MLGLGTGFYKIGGDVYLGGLAPPTKSMSFDGTNDSIAFTETQFDIEDDGDLLSIAFWAKRTDNNDIATVLGNSAGGSKRIVFFDADGDLLTITADKSSGQHADAPVTADTNWHHYAITMSGVSGNVAVTAMYEDGSAITVDNTNLGAANNFDLTLNRIGTDNATDGSREFKGLLYQIAIWDAVLDAAAVAAIYNGGDPISLQLDSGNYDNSDDLIHLWKFDEGSGSSTADTIGSLDGTITNATFSSTIPSAG
tara:strand:+ start:679 stop:1437 length:759 start_codon:yes stop_codon:yes gene_type:complete